MRNTVIELRQQCVVILLHLLCVEVTTGSTLYSCLRILLAKHSLYLAEESLVVLLDILRVVVALGVFNVILVDGIGRLGECWYLQVTAHIDDLSHPIHSGNKHLLVGGPR